MRGGLGVTRAGSHARTDVNAVLLPKCLLPCGFRTGTQPGG